MIVSRLVYPHWHRLTIRIVPLADQSLHLVFNDELCRILGRSAIAGMVFGAQQRDFS